MSSRNAYLGPEDRAAAGRCTTGSRAAAELAASGERDASLVEAAARAVIEAEPRCALEYAAAVDPTLRPAPHPGPSRPAGRRRPRGLGAPDRQDPAPHPDPEGLT